MVALNRTPTERLIDRLNRNPILLKILDLRFTLGYRLLSSLLTRDDVLFLNYGYEEDPPMALQLASSDEPDRFPIQLYHRTATQERRGTTMQLGLIGLGKMGGNMR